MHAPAQFWRWVTVVLGSVSSGALLGSLLLIALGWGITRHALPPVDRKRGLFLVIGFSVAEATFDAAGGFFLFVVVCLYLVLIRFIIMSVIERTRQISAQLQLLKHAGVDIQGSPGFQKLHMFKRVQAATLAFVCCDVILRLWASIFLATVPWVSNVLVSGIALLTACAVAWALRLRPFETQYFRVASADPNSRQQAKRSFWRPFRKTPNVQALCDAQTKQLQALVCGDNQESPVYVVCHPQRGPYAELVVDVAAPLVITQGQVLLLGGRQGNGQGQEDADDSEAVLDQVCVDGAGLLGSINGSGSNRHAPVQVAGDSYVRFGDPHSIN